MWKRVIDSFADKYDAFEWLGGASPLDVDLKIQEVSDDKDPCYLVVDVETNGGGKFGQLIVQLAFVVFTKGHVELFRFNRLVKLLDGAKMNRFAQKIHGISMDRLNLHGIEAHEALDEFICWCARVDRVVAHNAHFDVGAIENTCAQHCIEFVIPINKVFCTMRESYKFTDFRNRSGRKKMAKNTELFEYFYGPPPVDLQLHDALNDVLLTAMAFRGGSNANWW